MLFKMAWKAKETNSSTDIVDCYGCKLLRTCAWTMNNTVRRRRLICDVMIVLKDLAVCEDDEIISLR
jgi:hypothetical protein